MRKIHILLIVILILGIFSAVYVTFINPPIKTLNPSQQDAQNNIDITGPIIGNRKPIIANDTNIRASRVVDNRKFILVDQSAISDIRMILLEEIDGRYYPLDDEYSWMNNYINEYTTDFWIDSQNKFLYLVKLYYGGIALEYGDAEESEVVKIDYSDSSNITVKQLGTIDNVFYGSQSIDDYNPDYNAFIMTSWGGDACSGWGTVSTFNLNTGKPNQILEFGSACMQGTRYFGYHNQKLIVGEPGECAAKDTMSGSCVKSIYAMNPFNKSQKETLYTFQSPYEYDEGWTEEKISDNEIVLSKTVLISDNGKGLYKYRGDDYAFDLTTKSLRLLPGGEEFETGFNVDDQSTETYYEEPPVQDELRILKDNNKIKITHTNGTLVVQNKSDSDDYSFEVVNQDNLSKWDPCGNGCYSVFAGESKTINLSEYHDFYNARVYWWDFHSNPTTVDEVPNNNWVKLW